MGKSKWDKKTQVRRTRNKLAGNLEKLASARHEYIEKAKTAYKKGDKYSYNLARSGLATTLTQQRRTREMLLNIDITSQMRDTGEITEEFLTGMETIFRRLGKINKSVDIRKTQKGLRSAITGMESVQAQLDGMLLESEDTFAALSGNGVTVSDAEIDRLLGLNAATDEEEEIGEEIDRLLREERGETASPAFVPPVVAGNIPVPPPVQHTQPTPVREESKSGLRFAGKSMQLPPLELLAVAGADEKVREENERALCEDARKAEEVLAELGVPAKAVAHVAGPSFSRIEMEMPTGISVQKIDSLVSDIAMRLGKPARFEVPLQGKNAFGIEVPNVRRETVPLGEMIASPAFRASPGGVSYCLAVDIERNPVIKDLTRAPHLMIAGSTGSGKSCFLHSLITSLLYKYTPAEVRLALVDFKRVEMAVYNGLPHLLTEKAVDTDEDALALFNDLCEEMERRYALLVQSGCRNVGEYNGVAAGEKLPYIVVCVDEYADISTSPLCKEFDTAIRKLSQKARASGIHLVFATQRPSTDVISGTIKNNFPVQIAFKVARKEDSRTTLAGQSGAEALLGNGDMLYNEASGGGLRRLQAPYISGEELRAVTDWIRTHC